MAQEWFGSRVVGHHDRVHERDDVDHLGQPIAQVMRCHGGLFGHEVRCPIGLADQEQPGWPDDSPVSIGTADEVVLRQGGDPVVHLRRGRSGSQHPPFIGASPGVT